MKRTIISTISLLLLVNTMLYSQNAMDALRYSQMYYGTTARSAGLGGAMGALGADFGSISINPAALGVYRKSEFSISPLIGFNQIASSINSSNNYTDFQYDFRLGSMGLVGVFETGNQSGWISTNIGFGYNVSSQFDNRTSIRNLNAQSSLLDDFVFDANNGNWSYLWNEVAQQADVIFYDDNIGAYTHDFENSAYGQIQRRSISEKGSIGEYLFSLGANYNNNLFLGANLGITSLRYSSLVTHTETGIPENSPWGLSRFTHTENVETRGTGVNLKIGAIYTPVYWFRAGVSLHSPVFYSMRESYTGSIDANFDSLANSLSSTNNGEFDYELITPPRLNLSAAFVLGKQALVSFDYEIVNYSLARLRSDTYMFDTENESVQNMYHNARNLRLGAEYRISAISFRGGVFYMESPYAQGELNSNADILGYSMGFGVNNSSYFIDFAYTNRLMESNYVLYQSPFLSASLQENRHQLVCTFGIRF